MMFVYNLFRSLPMIDQVLILVMLSIKIVDGFFGIYRLCWTVKTVLNKSYNLHGNYDCIDDDIEQFMKHKGFSAEIEGKTKTFIRGTEVWSEGEAIIAYAEA